MEDVPVKLRCATCSQIALNALRLPCCEQNICETCEFALEACLPRDANQSPGYNELEDVCQVCHHEPLDKTLCTPNKSLRTTTKIFLKKKILERSKEQKKAEQEAAAAAAAHSVLGATPVQTSGPDPASTETAASNQASAEALALPAREDHTHDDLEVEPVRAAARTPVVSC